VPIPTSGSWEPGNGVTAPDGWDVSIDIPVDLLREVDLIEEVGRHYGFDKLAATFPVVIAPPRLPTLVSRATSWLATLTAAGLSEA
jgi:phenylalanyl-tRNA synthetase beta subunit